MLHESDDRAHLGNVLHGRLHVTGAVDCATGNVRRPARPVPWKAETREAFVEHGLFEPRLLPALAALTESQRVVVVLVHGYGWSQTEVARLLDVSHATVRTHLARALVHLQKVLEVREHAD